ncbi:MAG: hypothetical protein C0595_09560 [Marinilabiliales bacterium]|nr:MAG: hypothetical protein C0595_09560 [Marinilabiliales bacterium]
MKTNSIYKSPSNLPEGFYDLMVYIISSLILVLGYLYISNNMELINKLNNNSTWVFELLMMLFILGGLYTIGILITTFSKWIFFKPCELLLSNRLKNKKLDFTYWEKELIKIKSKSIHLNNEITKRYARFVMLRNLAFSSLVLSIIELQFGHYNFLFLIIFSISLIAYILRLIELIDEFDTIKDELEPSTNTISEK